MKSYLENVKKLMFENEGIEMVVLGYRHSQVERRQTLSEGEYRFMTENHMKEFNLKLLLLSK